MRFLAMDFREAKIVMAWCIGFELSGIGPLVRFTLEEGLQRGPRGL
jgi:hypothetical protein